MTQHEKYEARTRLYAIHGWRADGQPLVKQGRTWMGLSGLSRTQKRLLDHMEVSDKLEMFLKTAAGPIEYTIERTA